MDINDYLFWTRRTAVYPGSNEGKMPELSYLALGLAGEVGETVEVIKKAMRKGAEELTEEQKAKLVLEMGDVMWYWVRMCDAMGVAPYDVIKYNIQKLNKRMDDGTVANDNHLDT